MREGAAHMKEAEQAMKTSLLKWKADYDTAASAYGKAATCFKNAKSLEKAKDCQLKAAEAHKKNGNRFHAGKALEQAALICRDLKDYERTADLGEEAAQNFREGNVLDTAVHTLDKIAKTVEVYTPSRAVQLYLKAAEIVDNDDRSRQAIEYYGKAARLLVRQQQYEEALKIITREIDAHLSIEAYTYVYKLVAVRTLVYLTIGDYLTAERECRKGLTTYPGFGDSEEAVITEQLLEAYDQGDAEAANKILNGQRFKYLDNEYAKLARNLRVPEMGVGAGGVSLAAERRKIYEVIKATEGEEEEEEDEYAEGLC